MGFVRIDGDDESQPRRTRRKRYKLPEKLPDEHDAVNHSSVPKKPRFETKNRGRESTIPPLPVSRKRHRASTNRVETLGKHGAKKSRLNMKQGNITKDEEEVAETLYALANMFSDIDKTNEPVLDGEPSQTKSSNVVEPVGSITAAEDADILTVQEESRKPYMIRSCEKIVVREQVSDFGVHYDKRRHLNVDKYKGVFSDWFENTNCATQSSAGENIVTANKIHCHRVVLESKKSRGRCPTHVHLARLIKTMGKSERKLRSMQRPTQLTTTGGIVQKKRTIGGGRGVLSFNGFTRSSSEQLSLSKNGYSSALDCSTSSAAAAQQKRNAQLQARYNPHSGYNAPALFPHLHSALGSKYYPPFSTPQQQFMPVDSSLTRGST